MERISYADLMPSLVSLANNPETEKELREAYRSIEMWKMTLKQDAEEIQEEVKGESFRADLMLSGTELRIALGGRLDTISAPELLEKYERIVRGQAVSTVDIDAQNLQYVSSAGIRVLLMIYKALNSKENFRMLNVNEDVKGILEVTGFDTFFL
ncbi:MAG: STAS domain-containing protein [Clostridia bacterium]|nr:STAS domain-containing protein [Clostridia bacterium]